MNEHTVPYAGMIVPDTDFLDVAPYLDAAEIALLKHDPSDTGVRRLNRKASVLGRSYAVKLEAEEHGELGPKMILRIVTRDGVELSEEKAARILSDAVLHALEDSPCDVIEWFSPDVLLDSADFIRLRSYVSPQRFKEVSSSPDLEMTCSFRAALSETVEEPADEGIAQRIAALKTRVAALEPADLRMGAASFAMTGLIAMVSLPVAAAVSVVNLMRGPDFRLTTQALSVTALFVGVESSVGLNTLMNIIH